MLICPTCFHILGGDDEQCPTCGTRQPTLGWEREDYLGLLLLDRYEIVQRLGAGATGAVYLAHDRKSADAGPARRVAVKFLHRKLGQDEKLALRFRREALASSQITSPYVARTIAYGELADGARFLVMEHIRGHGLHNFLRDNPKVPTKVAIDLALQIAEALAAAHQVGIVHRDLKPANIFLVRQPDGGHSVKVLDFGYAFIKARERGGLKLTQTGLILGTPTYMSPEQTQGRRDIDGRSDLYALGVLLYRMLTGRPPFEADSIMELVLKHRNEQPPRLTEVDADGEISPALESVVLKLLRKRREDRYPTAAALREALLAAASGREVAPDSSSAEGPGEGAGAGEEGPREGGGKRSLWIAGGIVLAAAAAAAAVLAALGVFDGP